MSHQPVGCCVATLAEMWAAMGKPLWVQSLPRVAQGAVPGQCQASPTVVPACGGGKPCFPGVPSVEMALFSSPCTASWAMCVPCCSMSWGRARAWRWPDPGVSRVWLAGRERAARACHLRQPGPRGVLCTVVSLQLFPLTQNLVPHRCEWDVRVS